MALGAPLAATATPLLDEPFGDDIVSTCDAAWVDDCEEDWDGIGNNDTCLMSVVSSTNWGVSIAGGTTPNGVSRRVSLPSQVDGVDMILKVHGLTGTSGNFIRRLRFRNLNEQVIHTAEFVTHVAPGDAHIGGIAIAKPDNAVSVDVDFAAMGSGYSVWVDKVELISAEGLKKPSDGPNSCDIDALNEGAARSMACGASAMVTCDGSYMPNGVCNITCNGDCGETDWVRPYPALTL